jgi:hypothetical protein
MGENNLRNIKSHNFVQNLEHIFFNNISNYI